MDIDELVQNEICIILIFLLLALITAACPRTRWRYSSKTRRGASNNQSEQKPFQSCDDYRPIQQTNPGNPDCFSAPGHCPSHRWRSVCKLCYIVQLDAGPQRPQLSLNILISEFFKGIPLVFNLVHVSTKFNVI